MNEYKFEGLLSDMHQRQKKTKNIGFPHTMFSIATNPVDQKIFEQIIGDIALGGHHVEITIKTVKRTDDKTNTVSVENV